MNDKIKQLRKQALNWVQHNLETVERDHAVMEHEQLEMANEKFAELILMECCRAIRHEDSRFGGKFQGIILRHFGVEE